MFQSVESYYYSANTGRHSLRLAEFMSRVTDTFVKRVRKERYKKPRWGYQPPKEHTLSDQDITEFVTSLKPVVLHAMFSKWGMLEAGSTLQSLATLRPELVVPSLVERLYAALDTVTQPLKLTASLFACVSVARSMVTYNRL